MTRIQHVVTVSLSFLINGFYYYNISLFPLLIITTGYYLYDIKHAEPIYKAHHVFAVLLGVFYYLMDINGYNQIESTKTIISIEQTTPFFILCLYNNHICFKLIFFCMFLKCRILTQYNLLLYSDEFTHYPVLGYVSHGGLFVINLYWFVLMCKKIAKPLKNITFNTNTNFYKEDVLEIINWSSIFIIPYKHMAYSIFVHAITADYPLNCIDIALLDIHIFNKFILVYIFELIYHIQPLYEMTPILYFLFPVAYKINTYLQ